MWRDSLKRAIKICGSQARLAAGAGVNQSRISQVLNGRHPPSAELARGIESATGGMVSAADLRPDLFGPLPAPHDSPTEGAA